MLFVFENTYLPVIFFLGTNGVKYPRKNTIVWLKSIIFEKSICRCPANPVAKEAIVKATDTDSVATGYSRNLGVRCLANAFTDAYTAREIAGAPKEELMAMGTGTNRKGIVEGDIVNGTVMCGQSLNVLNDILPCKDVMERIIAEAKEAIANVQKIEL